LGAAATAFVLVAALSLQAAPQVEAEQQIIGSICDASGMAIGGGLSNQIMQVAWLVRHCCEAVAPHRNAPRRGVVILPTIFSDLSPESPTVTFDQLFDFHTFAGGMKALQGCIVLGSKEDLSHRTAAGELAVDRDSWTRITPTYCGMTYGDEPDSWLPHVYGSLAISRRLRDMSYDDCYSAIHGMENQTIAVHLRMERDWYPTTCGKWEKAMKTRVCYTPKEVMRKLMHTRELLGYKTALLLYAEDRTPAFKGVKEVFAKKFEVRTVATTPGCRLKRLSYGERSVVSFFLGASSSIIVGTHHSTFSNMMRLHRERQGIWSRNYLYDCSPKVGTKAKKTAVAGLTLALPYHGHHQEARACGHKVLTLKPIKVAGVNDHGDSWWAKVLHNQTGELGR